VAICSTKSICEMKNNLKDLRKSKNISQNDLADELSVSRQTVNSIENGKFDPSLTLAIKLTKYFKVPLEEIFIYED
jgi:putative transcriptional regulator